MIPLTESLKDTYNRVIPFFESEIKPYLLDNKNIIVAAHGNSLRALCKKIFNISDQKINDLEIPTGNPLVIEFNQNLEIKNIQYLDKGTVNVTKRCSLNEQIQPVVSCYDI